MVSVNARDRIGSRVPGTTPMSVDRPNIADLNGRYTRSGAPSGQRPWQADGTYGKKGNRQRAWVTLLIH